MKQEDLLIKNTTREQRQQIVNDSLGITDGSCDGCASGLIDMYDDYIEGRKELAEINAEFSKSRGFIMSGDDEQTPGGCGFAG